MSEDGWTPSYSKWRHGGWYVDNLRYPSGAVGCVSCNYPDRAWRIVCGNYENTFASRDDAARAEYHLVQFKKLIVRTDEAQRVPDSWKRAVT